MIAGGEITGGLRGEGVDLAKVARLAGVPVRVAGRANVDVKLASSGPGSRRGHVDVEVTGGEVAGIAGLSGHLATKFDGDEVRADGLLQLASPVVPPPPPRDRRPPAGALRRTPGAGTRGRPAMRRLRGALLIRPPGSASPAEPRPAADDWDLRCLRRQPRQRSPPRASSRTCAARSPPRATLERAPGAPLPSVRHLLVKTEGLELTGMGWKSLHTDVELDGLAGWGHRGRRRRRSRSSTARRSPRLRLEATLDLPALLGPPARRWASLRRARFLGKVYVPRHAVTAFAGLPSFVTERVPLLAGYGDTLAGDVQLDAELGGTLDVPSVDAHCEGWGLAQATIPEPVLHVNGCAAPPAALGPGWAPGACPSTWTPTSPTTGRRQSSKGSTCGTGPRGGQRLRRDGLPIANLLAGRAHPQGDFHVTLDRVPLGAVPHFADLEVGGHLSGTLALNGLGAETQPPRRPEPARPRDRPRLSSTTAPRSRSTCPRPPASRSEVARRGRAVGPRRRRPRPEGVRGGLVAARRALARPRSGPPGRGHAGRGGLSRRGAGAALPEEDRQAPRRHPRRHGARLVERARPGRRQLAADLEARRRDARSAAARAEALRRERAHRGRARRRGEAHRPPRARRQGAAPGLGERALRPPGPPLRRRRLPAQRRARPVDRGEPEDPHHLPGGVGGRRLRRGHARGGDPRRRHRAQGRPALAAPRWTRPWAAASGRWTTTPTSRCATRRGRRRRRAASRWPSARRTSSSRARSSATG